MTEDKTTDAKIRTDEREKVWHNFLDALILDDKEFNRFNSKQWAQLKKMLYPLTHGEVRDFIPCNPAIEVARADERNNVIEEVLAMLPEEATEKNSAKVSTDYIYTYDQCLAWNEYRKYAIRNITNLRSKL